MEGRVQESTKATPPPGEAKEDWRILRALSEYLGQILPFDTHEELRAHLVQDFPIFKKRNVVNATPESGIYAPIIDARLAKAKLSNREFHSSITDSYLSNVITGHSPILAECSKIQKDAQKNELKNSQKNLQAKSSLKKGERHV
jgi:NADH-quinone oxidoreductase subunit G